MFNKYEVYTTTESIYCYKGTNVLKNKLNIRNFEKLKEAEDAITTVKQYCLYDHPVEGRFTKTHFLNIHKYIFEDVYSFAGKIRKEQISKGTTTFYPPSSIDKELDKVFLFIKKNKCFCGFDKDSLYDALAYVMAELNIIHPFREGNGRTIREFVRILAQHNGVIINWGNVDKKVILDSSIESVDDYSVLIDVIRDASDSE